MSGVIDARGLSCPAPVVMTKQKLDEMDDGAFDVLVDNKSSSQNVARFVQNAGCRAEVEERDGMYIIHVTKSSGCAIMPESAGKEIVVFVSSNTIGRGDDELGAVLMRSFVLTLLQIDKKPGKMIFMNSGVKLTVESSPVLEYLQTLEKDGVVMLACGTCLDYFGLKSSIKVGRVSNMFEILQALLKADIVLNL